MDLGGSRAFVALGSCREEESMTEGEIFFPEIFSLEVFKARFGQGLEQPGPMESVPAGRLEPDDAEVPFPLKLSVIP